jgi:hypothetical protein
LYIPHLRGKRSAGFRNSGLDQRFPNKLSTKTQHLESFYQRKLAALDELKKSLLHQAFSGPL